MNTPFGRFCWSRLPFGLNVSGEIFARKLNEALNGLDGVFTIADDIIVVGGGATEQMAKCDNEKKLEKLYKHCEQMDNHKEIFIQDSIKNVFIKHNSLFLL